MKSSEYLEEAARRIEAGAETFVCHTLYYLSNEGTKHIRNRILDAIAPHGTVGDWLNATHPDHALSTTRRDYRAAWCRWMAEGYRAIGD